METPRRRHNHGERRTFASGSGASGADEVSEAFGVDVSPFVFVVDEGGSVVARSGVATLDDVLRLVRDAEGVRIVAAGGA